MLLDRSTRDSIRFPTRRSRRRHVSGHPLRCCFKEGEATILFDSARTGANSRVLFQMNLPTLEPVCMHLLRLTSHAFAFRQSVLQYIKTGSSLGIDRIDLLDLRW